MSAKAKVFGVLLSLTPVCIPAYATGDICENLASTSPQYVQQALINMSDDVLGKPADLWTSDDFNNLLANVKACDGKPENVQTSSRVNYGIWTTFLKPSAERILPITGKNAAVMAAYKPFWNWGEVPSCKAILSWRRDKVWYIDNSNEIFGRSISDMTNVERAYVDGYLNECAEVVASIASILRHSSDTASRIIKDIKASINREVKASEEDLSQIAESLQIYRDGKRIPLAYIGPTALRWVSFANQFELRGEAMRVEDMVNLSRWVEKVDDDKEKESPEILYARAVREIVSKRMFGRD